MAFSGIVFRASAGKAGYQMKERNEKLSFRQTGRGFIIDGSIPGMPTGRRLTKTFVDQFNRKYIQINGRYELLTAEHSFLSAD